LLGLALLGAGGRAVLALRDGHVFYGANYWGAPLGAYTTIAVVVVASGVAVVWLIRRLLRGRQTDT